MDIFEGKNKRYCKRLTKFCRNIVLRIKPRAAMFVVRFANSSLARYLTNPRVIAWLPVLKGPLEPRLLKGNSCYITAKLSVYPSFYCNHIFCHPVFGFVKKVSLVQILSGTKLNLSVNISQHIFMVTIYFWRQKIKYLPRAKVNFSCRVNHNAHVFTSHKMILDSLHIKEVSIRSPEK